MQRAIFKMCCKQKMCCGHIQNVLWPYCVVAIFKMCCKQESVTVYIVGFVMTKVLALHKMN